MLIFSQFGEIAWQRLFNIVRILQTIALKLSQATAQIFIHINQNFNETAHCANGSLLKILGLFWSKTLDVNFTPVYIRYTH